MKKFWPLIVLIFLCTTAALSQQPAPKPTPPDDDDVVKISTNLIQLDVTVTDKKGNPVSDLRPDEIKIYENGKLRKVSHMSFVQGTRTAAKTVKEKGSSQKAPILPPGAVRPEDVRRTVAILVDDINLSFASAFWVKEALKKYVNEQVQDGDMVALVRSSGGSGALQQFTTDRRLLKAAVDNIKFYPGMLARLDPFGAGVATDEDEKITSFRNEYYSFGAFQMLAQVIAGMNRMPGRKSIALLSDGFGPPGACSQVIGDSVFERALENVVDYANRSSVVINTIQAAGVEYPGITAADDVWTPKLGVSSEGGHALTDPIVAKRVCNISTRQRVLTTLARDTGGLGMVENNINKSIRRILDDQSYYLVAYEPDEGTFNAKNRRFNRFRVEVSRPDVKVRSRSGFFGFADTEPAKLQTTANAALLDALTSPFAASDIFVRMNAVYTTDEKQKPYIKAFINVNASDLTIEKQPNNTYKTSFDIIAVTADSRGRVMDARPKNYTLTLGQREYENLLAKGLVTTFLVSMPGPGGYQVRLAVRDSASKQVGSANQYVEIPNLKKKRLALSGLVLNTREMSGMIPAAAVTPAAEANESKMLRDTSLRQFRPGSILDFGYQIFNAKLGSDQKTKLSVKLKLYREGKPVFESSASHNANIVDVAPQIFSSKGSLRLGGDLPAGDYILQVDVIDTLADAKHQVATQFVQFDIIN